MTKRETSSATTSLILKELRQHRALLAKILSSVSLSPTQRRKITSCTKAKLERNGVLPKAQRELFQWRTP